MNHFQPYTIWLQLDLVYLSFCDALIRLPGESNGADGEVRKAEELNIPVFYDIESLLQWSRENKSVDYPV